MSLLKVIDWFHFKDLTDCKNIYTTMTTKIKPTNNNILGGKECVIRQR